MEEDRERAIFWATSFERSCAKPLAGAGHLGGVLLQLSPYFKNEGSSLRILKDVLDAVSPGNFDYAVEFRHRSWLDESKKEIDPATLEALRERNAANVLIDGPGLHAGGAVRRIMPIFAFTAATTISGTGEGRRTTTGWTDTTTSTARISWRPPG